MLPYHERSQSHRMYVIRHTHGKGYVEQRRMEIDKRNMPTMWCQWMAHNQRVRAQQKVVGKRCVGVLSERATHIGMVIVATVMKLQTM